MTPVARLKALGLVLAPVHELQRCFAVQALRAATRTTGLDLAGGSASHAGVTGAGCEESTRPLNRAAQRGERRNLWFAGIPGIVQRWAGSNSLHSLWLVSRQVVGISYTGGPTRRLTLRRFATFSVSVGGHGTRWRTNQSRAAALACSNCAI